MALTTIYKCADGTDFPVTWEDPADAEQTWMLEREHFRLPFLPLESEVFPRGVGSGWRRAADELGLPAHPEAMSRIRIANGFAYFNRSATAESDEAAMFAAHDRMADSVDGSIAVWEQVCRPRVQAVCERLAAAKDDAGVRELYEEMCYGWGFTQLLSPSRFAMALGQFCTEEFGPEGAALATELTQGYLNPSVEADEALWQLAQIVTSSEKLRRAVAGSSVDLVVLEADEPFWLSFQDFLNAHGDRAGQWQLHAPTWRERPASVLAVVARLIEADGQSPLQKTRAAAARRDALLAQLEERLKATPEKVEQLRRLFQRGSYYGPIKEGKAYWQLLLFGHARQALMRIGERLVREGRIAQAEDILFLTPEEIDDGHSSDMSAVSAQRRELWQERMRLSPPDQIGGEQPGSTSSPAPVAQEELTTTIKGSPASRGVVTATARIIESPDEGGRLSPGEVLVCVLSSPAWTSLFAIAGAVVTEGGGALSHPAIVAREYGIPCVVGARQATSRIQDGQLITVDGTKGEVRLEE